MSDRVTCPVCGFYVPGHATGSADICTCEPDSELTTVRDALIKIGACRTERELCETCFKIANDLHAKLRPPEQNICPDPTKKP